MRAPHAHRAVAALKSVKKRRVAVVGALTAVVLVAVASVAGASIAQRYHGNKVVVACYKNDTGAIRIVKKADQCKSNETALRWYRSGKTGATGARGVAGAKGANGTAGADGADGATLLSGAVSPTPANGNDGDYWFDTTSSLLHGPKAAGVWPAGISLKGVQGVAGTPGAPGLPGTPGTPGLPGTPGTPGTNGAPGAPGADGAPGTNGEDGTNGTNGQDGTNGTNGTNGEDGEDGAAGADGAMILSGAAAPLSTDGANGDYWLDTTSGHLYGPKASGTWPIGFLALRGADGEDGEDGALGLPGAPGTPGEDGEDGAPGTPGAPGEDGEDGEDGAPGAGAILSSSTGSAPGVLTTIIGGLTGTGTVLPLSGSYGETGISVAGSVDVGAVAGVVQQFPRNGTITAVTGSSTLSVALSLIGTTIDVHFQVYKAEVGSSTLSPVAGASCTVGPALTGLVFANTRSTCLTDGLSIPVLAGESAVVVASATANGLTLVNSVASRLAASVAVS